MKLRNIGVLAVGAMLAFSACSPPSAGQPRRPPRAAAGSTPAETGAVSMGTVNFAIELPQQGSEKAASDPIINGIKLAVKQAGGSGRRLHDRDPERRSINDDALNGAHDPQTGATNMSQIVAIPEVIGVIGPLNSNVADGADPDLERGRPRAVLAREHEPGPDQGRVRRGSSSVMASPNNYIRVVTTDDVQGPAAAQYLYDDARRALGLHHRRHRDLREGRRGHVRGGLQGPRRHGHRP